MRSFDTTLVVDTQGRAHVDQPLDLAPGRHRAVVMIDEDTGALAESWHEFIERTYGSLAESGLERHAQGAFELRDEMG